MNANRILRIFSRGTSGGNRGRSRASGRPRGEGLGMVGVFRRLTGRR